MPNTTASWGSPTEPWWYQNSLRCALRVGSKSESHVPDSSLPKRPPQCFVPVIPWPGEKQHEACCTMPGVKESLVWGLAGWGEPRWDRTVCFAPTGCKKGVWRRHSRGCRADVLQRCEVGATSQCLQVDFFPGKQNSCQQEAPKLFKALASPGLFTNKIAHRFMHCPPLSIVFMDICTQLQRDLEMSLLITSARHSLCFLAFSRAAQTTGAAHRHSLHFLKICCFLFGLV